MRVRAGSRSLELLETLQEVADRYAGAEWGMLAPDDVAGRAAARGEPARGRIRRPLRRRSAPAGVPPDRHVDAQEPRRQRRRDLLRRRGLGAILLPRARPHRRRGVRVVHGRGGRGRRRVPASHRRRASTTPSSTSTPTAVSRSSSAGRRATATGSRSTPTRPASRTRHYWEQARSPAIPPIPDTALEIEVLDDLPPPPAADRRVGRGRPAARRRTTSASRSLDRPSRARATSPRSCRASRTRSRSRSRPATTRSPRSTPRTAWRRTCSVPTRRS